MLTVLFFGQLQERLQTKSLSIDINCEGLVLDSVTKLRQHLQQKGDMWQEYLIFGQALVAVNQEMAEEDVKLSDTDEVAFFPPVTGG